MDTTILLFIAAGFLAQIIDGALGMAYGVSLNTLLLTLGLPPAVASASVHTAEVATSGVSGFSHWRLKNVDGSLFIRLVIPGVIGACIGAYLLSAIDGDFIKPFLAVYLIVMGVVILVKAFRKTAPRERPGTPILIGLGLAGSFLDAIGGGGWGPVVTSSLLAGGQTPRKTIGTVSLAEFFVTTAASITFVLNVDFHEYWQIILGLLIGGVLAAPIAAIVCKKVNPRVLMFIVGILILVLSVRVVLLSGWF